MTRSRMKTFAAAGCAVAVGLCWAEMEPATPESQGVETRAILDWIDACERTFDGGEAGRVHGFVIVRHGKTIAEGSWKPFDTLNEPHMLYSHSKSFTSSAVGFLADEGKIDLDERVVDVFPDKLPAKVSENLRQLRVRDLLTMNVGKKDHLLRDDGDWVASFLAQDFDKAPGTGFKYDSDATYMLSAIVEKRTGTRLMDFLRARMFDKIGISRSVFSTTSPQGIACGGWGMNMTTRDMARFGQLYLQQGEWNGEQVLSPYWTTLATVRHTWSGWRNVGPKKPGEGDDWEQGYGFQFWRCRHGAFRADGAAGQITAVIPSKDMVVSISAGLNDINKELALVWDYLLPGAKDGALADDAEAAALLNRRLATLAFAPVAGRSLDGVFGFLGKTFAFKKNRRGIESVRFEADGNGLSCTVKVPVGEQKIPVGVGSWKAGEMGFDAEGYEWLGAYVGRHRTAASAGVGEDGSLRMRVYFTGDTGRIDVKVTPALEASGEFTGMAGTKLEGVR